MFILRHIPVGCHLQFLSITTLTISMILGRSPRNAGFFLAVSFLWGYFIYSINKIVGINLGNKNGKSKRQNHLTHKVGGPDCNTAVEKAA